MNWLERHSDGLFKLTGIFIILDILVGIWALYDMTGLPNNLPSSWTLSQWNLFNLVWKPTLIYSVVCFLFAVLSFFRKYIVFFFILLFVSPPWAKVYLVNFQEIMKYGFIYPSSHIAALIGLIIFFLGVIGAMLWIWRLFKRRG